MYPWGEDDTEEHESPLQGEGKQFTTEEHPKTIRLQPVWVTLGDYDAILGYKKLWEAGEARVPLHAFKAVFSPRMDTSPNALVSGVYVKGTSDPEASMWEEEEEEEEEEEAVMEGEKAEVKPYSDEDLVQLLARIVARREGGEGMRRKTPPPHFHSRGKEWPT